MKGDFTRETFDRRRHCSSVRMQQGRVQLDADWNEREEIHSYLRETEAIDVIGSCGTPLAPDGSAEGFRVKVVGGNPVIAGGRFYVDGILCENEADVPVLEQPDLPGAALPNAVGKYLFYLDVWERHLTALEVPEIREVALGGPDTASRVRTTWQVNWVAAPDDATCPTATIEGSGVTPPTDATLSARARTPDGTETCTVKPGARYQRLENQLYRVEVHSPGNFATATFKWSRDNGTVVTRLVGVDAGALLVENAGRDASLGFASGQWVEVTDNHHELRFEPGEMVQVARVEGDKLVLTAGSPAINLANLDDGRKVRRWDSNFPSAFETPDADGFMALEDGVQVKIAGTQFNTGDYWLIPARTNLGDVEWPEEAGGPKAVSPHGVQHHRCKLGVLSRSAGGVWTEEFDCRSPFPPLTAMESLFYLAGDGQEVTPVPGQAAFLDLPTTPLVGVARGRIPVAGARVRFSITAGGGSLPVPSTVVTGSDGLAACAWKLDPDTPVQTMRAELLDASGNAVHLPVTFTARLSVAARVAYDPKECVTLAGVATVQEAIDRLCHPGGEKSCCVSVGEGGDFKDIFAALTFLLEQKQRDACICLRPGEHVLDADLNLNLDRFHTFTMHGLKGDTRVLMRGVARFLDLDAVTLRDLTLVADGIPLMLDISRVGWFTLEHSAVNLTASVGAVAVNVANTGFVTITDNVISVAGKDDDPDFELTERLPREVRDLVHVNRKLGPEAERFNVRLSGLSPADRANVASGIDASLAGLRGMLSRRDREILRDLMDVLRVPVVDASRFSAIVKRLPGIGAERPTALPGAVALQFLDGRSRAWVERNQLRGLVSLYGRAGDRRVDHASVERIKDASGRFGPLAVVKGGELRLNGNSLVQVLFGDEFANPIADSPEKLFDAGSDGFEGVFADMYVTGNTFRSYPNELLAGTMGLASNVFQRGDRTLSGIAVAASATLVGNIAEMDTRFPVIASATEAAANIRLSFS